MTTQLVKSLYHVLDNPKFNKDCLSAGQIKSKDWLVQKVEETHEQERIKIEEEVESGEFNDKVVKIHNFISKVTEPLDSFPISPGGILNKSKPQNKKFIKKYSLRVPKNSIGRTSDLFKALIFLYIIILCLISFELFIYCTPIFFIGALILKTRSKYFIIFILS